MKYCIKKDKRQEAFDFILKKGTSRVSRVRNMIYEQKPMFMGKWARYFNLDEMEYFLEPFVGESANPICCICGEPCENEWGNNPYPIKDEGHCCDVCNATQVIPARMSKVAVKEDEQIEDEIQDTPVEEPTQEEAEEYYGI